MSARRYSEEEINESLQVMLLCIMAAEEKKGVFSPEQVLCLTGAAKNVVDRLMAEIRFMQLENSACGGVQ